MTDRDQDHDHVEPDEHGGEASGSFGRGARDRFDKDELREIVAAFPISGITTIREFHRGSRRSPKLRIHAQEGEFLLKRRAPRPNLKQRVAYNHEMIEALSNRHYPVARLVRSRDEQVTAVVRGEHVYELFEFVHGRRYDHSSAEVELAGEVLGRLHVAMEEWCPSVDSPGGTFHHANTVAKALNQLPRTLVSVNDSVNAKDAERLAEELHSIYLHASASVEVAGWKSLPSHSIHGDWHPGNILFGEKSDEGDSPRVAAVVDYDSSREEPRIVDLANGLVHFAMRSRRGVSPAEWPFSLSTRRMKAFVAGWINAVSDVQRKEIEIIPWLMVEAVIAESVVPVAETGCFATIPGYPFLQMVLGKAKWIKGRVDELQGMFDMS